MSIKLLVSKKIHKCTMIDAHYFSLNERVSEHLYVTQTPNSEKAMLTNILNYSNTITLTGHKL